MFHDRPLCEENLSANHKNRLEGLLQQLNYFLNTPGDWGYGTKLGMLCTAVKVTLYEVITTNETED